MSRLFFVTFASGAYKKNIFWNKFFVKLILKPNKAFFYTTDDLTDNYFFREHLGLFCEGKGGGLWAWKPLVILKVMDQMSSGDILLYQDCGKGLRYKNFLFPRATIEKMTNEREFLGYQVQKYGKNGRWTPEKVLEALGLHLTRYKECPHVEAVTIFWRVSPRTKAIVREWLDLCLRQSVFFHELNDREKCIYRYDQSLLSALVEKHGLETELSCTEIGMLSKSLWIQELGARKNKRFLSIIEFLYDKLYKKFRSI